jgi:hypothetical protein
LRQQRSLLFQPKRVRIPALHRRHEAEVCSEPADLGRLESRASQRGVCLVAHSFAGRSLSGARGCDSRQPCWTWDLPPLSRSGSGRRASMPRSRSVPSSTLPFATTRLRRTGVVKDQSRSRALKARPSRTPTAI